MILLLNCSFRGQNSNSQYFLESVASLCTKPCEILQLNQLHGTTELQEKLREAEAFVLGMPLYADGAPAQAVELMENLYAQAKNQFPAKPVYAVTNLGFYESRQLHLLLKIIKNWCVKMGMAYSGGLAIGGGEMMGGLRNVPLDQGPNKQMGEGMKKLAEAICAGKAIEDIYVHPSYFPRALYMMAASAGWNSQRKKNGLTKNDLYRRMG